MPTDRMSAQTRHPLSKRKEKPIFPFPSQIRKGCFRKGNVKKRREKRRRNARIMHFPRTAALFVRQKWNFFAERKKFLSAKTQISCRKEVSRSVENRKIRGFGRLFRSRRDAAAYKIRLTDCHPKGGTGDTARRLVRRTAAHHRQDANKKRENVAKRFPAMPGDSRISARLRLSSRTRVPRAAASDHLTL